MNPPGVPTTRPREHVSAHGKQRAESAPVPLQARRMLRREPILADLPRVSLPPGPPSEFRLRRQKDIRHVSTCEAAARALGCLDEPEAQRHLEEVFRIMVERTLWSRGELAASNVTGGIPTEAFQPVLSPRDKMKST